MIALNPEGSEKLYAEIMKWKPKPMNGVILEEAYQVFGEWDFAVLFQADTNENALYFAADIIRPIEGVAATFTLPIAPLRDYRKTEFLAHEGWMFAFFVDVMHHVNG